MGFLHDVFEIKKLASQIKKDSGLDDNANMKTAAACWTKAKAISAQASKYVLEYPVACTNQITDYQAALAISKQIELDCARFVILASGLNPIVDRKNGDTIEAHLNQMISSVESYGLPCTIEPATPEFIKAGKEYMDNYYSTELYHTFKDDDDFGAESLIRSSEAIENINAFSNEGDDPNASSDNDKKELEFDDPNYNKVITAISSGYGDREGDSLIINSNRDPSEQEFAQLYSRITKQEFKTPDQLRAELEEEAKANGTTIDTARFDKMKSEYDAAYKKYADIKNKGIGLKEANFIANNERLIKDKLSEIGPTIITVTLYLTDGAGGQRAIALPLAIKSTLQFIESPDLMRVLSGTQNNTKSLAKFIKVTTGQMSFFKDWLFAISETDKDLEREQALGTVPIFRRLLDAKNRYRLKTIAATRPVLAKFIAGKTQKDLPMCTIVCTTDELEDAFKQKWTYIYKNRKHIDEIIDTYMLLGLGVIDQTSDILYLFYAGENEPTIKQISKLGGGSADTNKSLADALVNTTRLLTRH